MRRTDLLKAVGSLALAYETEAGPRSKGVPSTVLGRTGQRVSRIGLGCAHFGLPEITPDDVSEVIHTALERGINYFDVALNYGSPKAGYAEEKMGPTVREVRDRMFLVTKTEDPTYRGTWRLIKQSLKRLRTHYLDLVHIHNFGMTSRFPVTSEVLGPRGTLGALIEAK